MQVLIWRRRRRVSTCSDAPVKVFNDLAEPCRFLLLSTEWPAEQSSVANTAAPERTQAKCHNSSAEAVETFKKGLSSVERRLFPRGSVWSPCGDNLKVWRLSFSPWQWRYPATAFVEVSGKSGAFEESCSSLSVAYNFDIWVSRVSGICFCIWKKKMLELKQFFWIMVEIKD